jgi:hypothetical protein
VRAPRGALMASLGGGLLAAAVLATVLSVPRSRADVDLTVDPAMTRGAQEARVTIVEFSDYQ